MKISIITCTHNPDKYSFKHLLLKLLLFNAQGHEIIIVDNKSDQHVKTMLQELNINQIHNFKYIIEDKLGLSHARQTGIRHATGDVIVFFDDDNLPDDNYIENVISIFGTHKFIGAIGPGIVEVIVFDNNGKTIQQNNALINKLYQEKHINRLEYSNSIKCMDAFPEGTGIAILKAIADAYASNVDSYQTTGRKGKSLASGEDFQILYHCLQLNFAAGRSPQLQMKHLIPCLKTRVAYIRRLKFGQTYSVPLALQECFPEMSSNNVAIASNLNSMSFLLGFLKEILSPASLKDKILRNLIIAHKSGWYYGYHLAAGSPTPYLVKLFIKLFKLK